MTTTPEIITQITTFSQNVDAAMVACTVHEEKKHTLEAIANEIEKGRELFITAFEYVARELSKVIEQRTKDHIDAILEEPMLLRAGARNSKPPRFESTEELKSSASIHVLQDTWTSAMSESVKLCREVVDFIQTNAVESARIWTEVLKSELGSQLKAPEAAELSPEETSVVQSIHGTLDALHKQYRSIANHSWIISARLSEPALG